jgi:predicted metal-dependent phosphoesterase TrpH
VKNSPLKIDLHVHTFYSEDASTTLSELIYCAKKTGLDGVAITDHGTLQGALKINKKSQLVVISGLEVEALGGHILALNVKTLIPPKLSITETVQKIHDAGGVAIIAHPGAILKTIFRQRVAQESNLDAVETINSAAFPYSLSTCLSNRLADRLNLPKIAGSDAHHAAEIGTAFTIIDADSNPNDIAEAIRKGAVTPNGKPITWIKRMKREAFKIKRLCRKHYSNFSI